MLKKGGSKGKNEKGKGKGRKEKGGKEREEKKEERAERGGGRGKRKDFISLGSKNTFDFLGSLWEQVITGTKGIGLGLWKRERAMGEITRVGKLWKVR